MNRIKASRSIIKIGVVAKYSKLEDAYLSLVESIKIAGIDSNVTTQIVYIDSEKLEKKNIKEFEAEMEKLKSVKGVIVPGGFGIRGLEGKITAIKFARTNKVPYLGICLGMQMAIVEIARNVVGLNAFSSEMLEGGESKKNKDLLIDYIPDQKHTYKKGGTMRLGGYDCNLLEGSHVEKLFKNSNFIIGKDNKGVKIRERHRHRLEVQGKFIKQLEENNVVVSGKHYFKNNAGKESFLVEFIELPSSVHPFFIGTQSHPEFLSRPDSPHPLFKGLVKAAIKVN